MSRLSRRMLKAAAMACLMACAQSASAHSLHEAQTIDGLARGAELIVRGTILEASQPQQGDLWATLRIEKILKGIWPQEQIRFASDIDHGVHYSSGERVVLFLRRSGGVDAPLKLISPQQFSAKYRITSFVTDGYDGLIAMLIEVDRQPAALRSDYLRQQLPALLSSPEAKVREIVAQATQRLGSADDRK